MPQPDFGGFGALAGVPGGVPQNTPQEIAVKQKRKGTKVASRALATGGEVTGQQNRFAYGMPFPLQSCCGVV